MRPALLIAGTCLAAGCAYLLWQSGDASPAGRGPLQAASPVAAGASMSKAANPSPVAVPSGGNGLSAGSLLAAPFASSSAGPAIAGAALASTAGQGQDGAAPGDPTPPPLSAADKAANDALRQLGYFVHERYYQMGLEALRKAAATQDVQALTHLAERYMFEFNGHPQAQGYEPGFAYMQAAREALQSAYVLGNRHAAAMLSESYLMERQAVDAAAWNLVAQRSGDKLSADWFLTTEDYRRLTEAQRHQATRTADQLWAALQARKPAGT